MIRKQAAAHPWKGRFSWQLAWMLAWTLTLAPGARAKELCLNGFDLSDASIPVTEIVSGGPPRDAIRALERPSVLGASDAPWGDSERILGLVVRGEARAYPLAILDWHELVNDTLGGIPILVSYCPLCGTGMIFERKIDGRARLFGVSGLLYRSDLLLFDRETESLWSQIQAVAVSGPMMGSRLKLLRSEHRSWGQWVSEHPKTTVLSPDTGYLRSYGRSPYVAYESTDRLYFSAPHDPRYAAKTPTLGIRTADGNIRAYPAPEVIRANGSLRERLGDVQLEIRYDEERRQFEVEAPESVEVIQSYWFAWSAFHPETTVFVGPGAGDGIDPPRE
jgi:hypothetical protein